MSRWRLCGHDGQGGRALALDGLQVAAEARGATLDAALAALAETSGPVLRVGEGAAAPLPAPLLPERGLALPDLVQKTPPDRIDGWTRLLLLGLTEARPHWDGVACVLAPKTAQWVHLSAGEAVSCLGFLTPRLVAALGGAEEIDAAALADSLSRPERLAAHLRAAEVAGRPAAVTGHLLGAELAAARPYWLGQRVAFIGGPLLTQPYAAALSAQGVAPETHDGENLALAGLTAARIALA